MFRSSTLPKASVFHAVTAEEPDKDRRQQDDCSGLFNEGPAAFPHAAEHIAHRRPVICRKLHNKGSRIAGKHLGFLQDNTGNNDGRNSHKVGTGRNPPRSWNSAPAIRAMIGSFAPQGIKVVVIMVILRSRVVFNGSWRP